MRNFEEVSKNFISSNVSLELVDLVRPVYDEIIKKPINLDNLKKVLEKLLLLAIKMKGII